MIVLICPNKYDLYYNYITQNGECPKPLFFTYWNNVHKHYIEIESMKILSDAVKTQKDVYFYDDTHWSPVSSQSIAKNIMEVINKNSKKIENINMKKKN